MAKNPQKVDSPFPMEMGFKTALLPASTGNLHLIQAGVSFPVFTDDKLCEC